MRCALLCAAVRCSALRVLGIRRHAHPLHDFTPSWLAAEVCPMQDKFKTQATEQVPRSHTGRSGKLCERKSVRCGSWLPAPQDGLERGRGVELIHRGVLLQVVHQQRRRVEPVQLLLRVPNAPRWLPRRPGKFCERTRTGKFQDILHTTLSGREFGASKRNSSIQLQMPIGILFNAQISTNHQHIEDPWRTNRQMTQPRKKYAHY